MQTKDILSKQKILIINSGEPGISEFTGPLEDIVSLSGAGFDTIQYRQTLTTDFGNYHGVIISGSPRGNDIVDHHLPYFLWIKETSLPVFGICAGHHITGAMYGARLLRSVEKEVGNNRVFIDRQDAIFKDIPSPFLAFQNHHDSITLPENFVLLAHSEGCRNSMMRHKDRALYTSQFHPETLNKEILINFIRMI
jgi:GMP synthase (glutamine-hydrolysing)